MMVDDGGDRSGARRLTGTRAAVPTTTDLGPDKTVKGLGC